ncbi:MAG: hypothetical protein DRO67_00235 [Candidatus Asgardarchaeum californiense]|nr:MAG: hypothetical protein DRO67_00235 [Candidatus Asgardarchaeum californiense]
MTIASCKKCGILYDAGVMKDMPKFIENEEYEDFTVDERYFAWSDSIDDFAPTINCPCCNTRIFKFTGEKV